MITISLCMIVKNEAAVIERCLESIVHCVDEIIVVDTGSEDDTMARVKKYTHQIYTFQWIQDFAAARNYAFSKATKEYILWLDADDLIEEKAAQKLLDLKSHLEEKIDVVMMPYHLCAQGTQEVVCTFPRERLVKRERGFKWYEPVHEYLLFSGKVQYEDIAIIHKCNHGKSRRNLDILEKLIKEKGTLSHRNTFYYGRELFINGYFEKASKQYEVFLSQTGGLPSNYVDASIDLEYCYKVLHKDEKRLATLMKSFEYNLPSAEICCKIGIFFKEKEDYEKAISWYKIALQLEHPKEGKTSMVYLYWDYIPYMELSWCYFKIGKLQQAIFYNEQGYKCRPTSEVCIKNKKILGELAKALQETL